MKVQRWVLFIGCMQENKYDVIIIGGGLAGLTAALHLRKEGLHILVIEKQTYPHHKVCGEYVSNEVLPYLEYLGVSLQQVHAITIDTFQLSTIKGKNLTAKLPLGGTGISRYAFDHLLYQKALSLGVSFIFETVDNVVFQGNSFIVDTSENTKMFSPLVIGSYGKRTPLDNDCSAISFKKNQLG